jgi:hypothetical protein
MKKIVLLLIGLVFFFPLFLLSQEQEAPEKSEPEKESGGYQYEITGKYKGKIEEKKLLAKLSLDPFSVVEDFLEDKKSSFIEKFATGVTVPPIPTLESNRILRPWLTGIVKGDISLFYFLYGKDVNTWELTILGPDGRVFRKFEGKGEPPSLIKWDGRSQDNKMLEVGKDYFIYGRLWDNLGNEARKIGKKVVKIEGILYQEGLKWMIDLAGESIFQPNSAKFNREKLYLLEEAKDLVKVKMSSKLHITVYHEKESLAERRRKALIKWFERHFFLPKAKILYLTSQGGKGHSKIQFSIF